MISSIAKPGRGPRLSAFLRLFHKKAQRPQRALWQLPPDLSHHLAQDIGLTKAEYARLRHRWPSENHSGH